MSIAQHERTQLTGLSYRAFAYPGDREALSKIRAIPGAAALFAKINEAGLDQYWQAQNLYTNVRVDARNYPKLHAIVADCARILDVTMPEVFVDYSAFYNAYTAGVRRTFVVINSSVIEDFSEPELRYIVGHELGHIKSGHVLYHSIGRALFRYSQVIFNMFPAAQLIYVPLAMAYFEWVRRSEFSCDRAGLLCVQDPAASYSALQMLAGRLRGEQWGEADLDAMIAQAEDCAEVTSALARLMLFYDNVARSHPYPILRLRELRRWVESGEYARIVGGEYAQDVHGEHELGRRVKCYWCGRSVNSKLTTCPGCGSELEWK